MFLAFSPTFGIMSVNRHVYIITHPPEKYMKKTKFLINLIILFMLAATLGNMLCPIFAAATELDPPIEITNDSLFKSEVVYLAETTTGTELYNVNGHMRRAPDSLVKIMTLLLAAEAVSGGNISRTEMITVSDDALFDISSSSDTIKLAPGEVMSFNDLMYSAYVGNGNDACNVLAERVAGSVAEFIVMMNTRAEELGCADTRFVNTHGQVNALHHTTASDLFMIMREALANSIFVEISGTVTYTTQGTNVSSPRSFSNSHFIIDSSRSRYYYRYAVTGRVSSSYENKSSCVVYAERDGMNTIAVIMGADTLSTEEGTIRQNMIEARQLLEWGNENYAWTRVLTRSDLVDRAPVVYGDGVDYVNLRPANDVTLLMPRNDTFGEAVTSEIRIYSVEAGEALIAPVNTETPLGEITLSRGGQVVANVKLVADSYVALQRITYIRQQLSDVLHSTWMRTIFAILLLLFIGYSALVIRYNILRARHVKKVRAAKQRIIDERRRQEQDGGPPQ